MQYGEQDPYSCFMHFHEVHELIIFENINGRYFYSQGESALQSNDLVFTPGLETHNFECADGPKSWYIVQFLPTLLANKDMADVANMFAHGLHLRLSPEHVHIVQQQTQLLLQSYKESPLSCLSISLLKTLILWTAKHAQSVNVSNNSPIATSLGYEKLKPIIDLFRHRPNVELSLVQAAETCFISPAYFSRLFKRVFRCNYSQYSLQHKLYSAARLITQTEKSVTEISYELNFSSPSHFVAQFKKQFAATPKKYRSEIKTKSS